MSKVYLVTDADIEKLRDSVELAKFKASFPLHKLIDKPNDMTAQEEQAFSRRWNYLVDDAHRHFNYYIHRWLDEVRKP